MKIEKNIILADNSEDRIKEFKEGLEKETKMSWNVCINVSNKLRKNIFDEIIRYIKYFLFPLKIFFSRKQINNIIAWQQFYGIIYAFYCNIFKVKKTSSLTIMTFIYKPKKKLGKLYFKFIKFAIDNKYVDNIIVFSNNEREYYSKIFEMPKEKFIFENLGINKIKIEQEYDNKGYILAPGRSNRDYKFLIETMKNEKYDIRIICDTLPNEKYGNIQVYNNVMGNKYFAMLQKADCVIIPLEDKNISSGQLVLLQAMQLRKPIIVTNAEWIKDYIIDGYNGFIINKNKDELMKALEKLKNKEIYDTIANNAYMEYVEKYSLLKLGENIGKIIKNKGK